MEQKEVLPLFYSLLIISDFRGLKLPLSGSLSCCQCPDLTMITSLESFFTGKSGDRSWGSTPLATGDGMSRQHASCQMQIEATRQLVSCVQAVQVNVCRDEERAWLTGYVGGVSPWHLYVFIHVLYKTGLLRILFCRWVMRPMVCKCLLAVIAVQYCKTSTVCHMTLCMEN